MINSDDRRAAAIFNHYGLDGAISRQERVTAELAQPPHTGQPEFHHSVFYGYQEITLHNKGLCFDVEDLPRFRDLNDVERFARLMENEADLFDRIRNFIPKQKKYGHYKIHQMSTTLVRYDDSIIGHRVVCEITRRGNIVIPGVEIGGRFNWENFIAPFK